MMIRVKQGSHHRLGGSSAYRYLKCAYAVPASEDAKKKNIIPKSESSYAANKGTAVHTIGEYCFRTGCGPYDYLGTKIVVGNDTFTFDASMANACNLYVDFCRGVEKELSADFVGIEHVSELGHLYDGESIGGPCDHVAIGKGVLSVNDYKNGTHPVEIKDNSQFLIYALGLYEELKDKHSINEIITTVIQPNYEHVEGPIRSHSYTVKELKRWKRKVLTPGVKRVQEATRLFEKGEIPVEGESLGPVPGDHCHFCPLNGSCKANDKNQMALVKKEFNEEGELPDPNLLTVEEAEEIIERSSAISKWLKEVELYRKHALENGDKSDRFKLIESLSNRVFKTKARRRIGKLIGDKIYKEKELLSPAQMEIAYREETGCSLKDAKDFITSLCDREVRGYSMVPLKDGRIKASLSALDDFAEELASSAKHRNRRKSRKSRKNRNV